MVGTRGQILWPKCTKFDFGWGSISDPDGGAYSTPPNPQLDSRGLLLKEGGEESGREGKQR